MLAPARFSWLRRVCLGALTLALSCGAPLTTHAAGPTVRVRLSHVVAPDTPKGRMAERFRTLVAQRSGGRIRVEIYPDSSLYGDDDEMEALRLGAVEMLAPSLSKFAAVGITEFEVFDLPFLFKNLNEVRCVTHGPIGEQLLQRLARQQMVGLGFLDNGFKQMSAHRPLQSPEAYRGLRLRVQASQVLADQMRALGAQPVVMSFGETQRALAQRVVDGTENPLSNFLTQRLAAVQPAITLSSHGYLGYAVVANPMFWNSLSPVDRQTLRRALSDALEEGNRQSAALDAQALHELRATPGVQVHAVSAPQRRVLRGAVQQVYNAFVERGGGPVLRDIQASCLR